MKIAVATTDGVTVNEHFGRATRFLIYDTAPTGLIHVDTVEVTPLSVNDPKHPFDPERFGAIAEKLSGCRQVFCTKIGDRPAKELADRNIEVVVYEGAINAIPTTS